MCSSDLPAGTRIVRATQPQFSAARTTDANSNAVVLGSVTASSAEALLIGAPGLGFDYTHLAAINRSLGVRALIDPVTQHRLALAREIRRETPVAMPFLPWVPSVQVLIVQSPPVVILQQPPATEELPGRAERTRYIEREPEMEAAPTREYQPLRELEDLVLVRRDGQLIYAAAFSLQRDRILYITREGTLRSLPLAELDVDATLRRNEERGTILRLPA